MDPSSQFFYVHRFFSIGPRAVDSGSPRGVGSYGRACSPPSWVNALYTVMWEASTPASGDGNPGCLCCLNVTIASFNMPFVISGMLRPGAGKSLLKRAADKGLTDSGIPSALLRSPQLVSPIIFTRHVAYPLPVCGHNLDPARQVRIAGGKHYTVRKVKHDSKLVHREFSQLLGAWGIGPAWPIVLSHWIDWCVGLAHPHSMFRELVVEGCPGTSGRKKETLSRGGCSSIPM